MKFMRSCLYILGDEKGEISFLGFTILLFVLSFCFITILKQIHLIQELRESHKKHLCIKYLFVETERYVSRITKLNFSIRTGLAMSIVPATRIQGKALIKTSKLGQNILHISYLKNISSNRYCDVTFKAFFLRSLPYQTRKLGSFLRRRVDGTTMIRKKKWSHHFLISKRRKSMELVKMSLSLKSSFSFLKGQVTTINRQAFRPSNLLFGSQSFYQ